jgi:hypothetical protein
MGWRAEDRLVVRVWLPSSLRFISTGIDLVKATQTNSLNFDVVPKVALSLFMSFVPRLPLTVGPSTSFLFFTSL